MVTAVKKTKNEAGQSKGVGKGRIGNYILLRSGQRFWPQDPRASELRIEDIAHSLALQCRFTGHTYTHYSVGQHSILAAEEAVKRGYEKRLCRTILMHDASEAILVDVPRPIKAIEGLGSSYKEIEDKIQRVISEKYDLIYPFPQEVIDMDLTLLITEQRDLMPWPKGEKCWFPEYEPLKKRIFAWPWNEIKIKFLILFKELS